MRAILVVALLAACGGAVPERITGTGTGTGKGFPFVLKRDLAGFAGEVVEVVDVAGYSYFLVGDRWVASLQKPIPVGAHVDVRSFGSASSFHSKQLDRTFDRVFFAVVTERKQP